MLPAPWDVRTRVHEYGGGAYAVRGGTVVFSHAGDDRVYRLDPGAGEPVAVTPPGPWRFGGLVVHDRHVYAVREDHSRDPEPANELVRLDLDGDNTDGGVVLATGTDFVSRPAVSPDGRSIAWVAWDHPSMPWDSTRAAAGRAHRGGRRHAASSWPGVPTSRSSSRPSGPTARCGSCPTSRAGGPCTATPARARWRCTTTAPTTPRRSGSWARSTSRCSTPTARWCAGGTPPSPGSACSTPAPAWSSRSTSRG